MKENFVDKVRRMTADNKSVEFPECFFGVKGYNHVHDKIGTMSVLGCIGTLIAAIACFILVDLNVWTWLLGLLALLVLTALGNILQVRWMYIPVMLVLGFCIIVWAFAVVGKIAYDLCWLNQPVLHKYFGSEIDRTFPPLSTEERVQVLTNLIMEFLLLIPVRVFCHIMSIFSKGFLYLEQKQKKKNKVLPLRIDPYLLSADSHSVISE
ncbi:hypothetical protein M3Y97_00021900 [Aphelenchoides bicaudatus]|nr:hypothetical protein M3Y97_00021900 [Aphelenchoides bicaudatus]